MDSLVRNPATLNTLFVSTSYPAEDADWRGRFISNLVKALCRRNDLHVMLWLPPGKPPPNAVDVATPRESAWLQSLLNDGGIAHVLRSQGVWAFGKILRLLLHLRSAYVRERSADVAHINWMQNAIPLWGTRKPAVISVLGSDYGLLQIPGMPLLLQSVFRQRRCILAPNAGWMEPRLKKLFGSSAAVRAIPYGVDEAWFNVERDIRRPKALKWIAVFRVTTDKIGPLFEWGRDLFTPPNELHLIGPMQETIRIPEWVHTHGPASPEELMTKWFPEARGLISLSRHNEGRPQVILEAMAAGLPVIASDLPAHRDVIQQRLSGWLVKSPEELKEALNALSRDDVHHQAAAAARHWVASEVGTWDDCAERYAMAYHDLMREGRYETR
jgi:hypothetical protein